MLKTMSLSGRVIVLLFWSVNQSTYIHLLSADRLNFRYNALWCTSNLFLRLSPWVLAET